MAESRSQANISERLAQERQRVAELKAEIAAFQKNLTKANALLPANSNSGDSSPHEAVDVSTSKQVLAALKAKLDEIKQEEISCAKVKDHIEDHYFLLQEAVKQVSAFDNKTQIQNETANQLLAEAAILLKK